MAEKPDEDRLLEYERPRPRRSFTDALVDHFINEAEAEAGRLKKPPVWEQVLFWTVFVIVVITMFFAPALLTRYFGR